VSYQSEDVTRFRAENLRGRKAIDEYGVQFKRHYTAATACSPSRACLYTGHYPSYHNVTQTYGAAKDEHDPALTFLDPDLVPTMGDYFRAAGYETRYIGKWHLSFEDLVKDSNGEVLESVPWGRQANQEVVNRYLEADLLDEFGFSGWVGPEPHGTEKENTGWNRDSHCSKPSTQRSYVQQYPKIFNPFQFWPSYRMNYEFLTAVVDQHIDRVYAKLKESPLFHDTIVILTSDHGDMLGAHGGMQQKWFSAYEEAMHIPLVISNPVLCDLATVSEIDLPSSSVDVLPTMLGLAGFSSEELSSLRSSLSASHGGTREAVGVDWTPVLFNASIGEWMRHSPHTVYMQNQDDPSRGLHQIRTSSKLFPVLTSMLPSGFNSVSGPTAIEAIVTNLLLADPSGDEVGGMWKLVRYWDDMSRWSTPYVEDSTTLQERPDAGQTVTKTQPLIDEYEFYNIITDPTEEVNLHLKVNSSPYYASVFQRLLKLLDEQRAQKRLVNEAHTVRSHRLLKSRRTIRPYLRSGRTRRGPPALAVVLFTVIVLLTVAVPVTVLVYLFAFVMRVLWRGVQRKSPSRPQRSKNK